MIRNIKFSVALSIFSFSAFAMQQFWDRQHELVQLIENEQTTPDILVGALKRNKPI